MRPFKATILAISICYSFASLANAEQLKNLSLDNLSSLGLHIESDAETKTEGTSSIKVTTKWPTSICLGEVSNLNIEDAQLVFRAKVKGDLDGAAYLEMWIHLDQGQYFSRGMNSQVKGKTDWTTIQTPFNLQKGQIPKKITLNLVINGKGTVWIDEVTLSKETLPN